MKVGLMLLWLTVLSSNELLCTESGGYDGQMVTPDPATSDFPVDTEKDIWLIPNDIAKERQPATCESIRVKNNGLGWSLHYALDSPGEGECRVYSNITRKTSERRTVRGIPCTPDPTMDPTFSPTTNSPTKLPTRKPTDKPTGSPTKKPTHAPTTAKPTKKPTARPTKKPTHAPTTAWPTHAPTTAKPTKKPSHVPTGKPTHMPTTTLPTRKPTDVPTERPTSKPTGHPTRRPTELPTKNPTKKPSKRPTKYPTDRPTYTPSRSPTQQPHSKNGMSPRTEKTVLTVVGPLLVLIICALVYYTQRQRCRQSNVEDYMRVQE